MVRIVIIKAVTVTIMNSKQATGWKSHQPAGENKLRKCTKIIRANSGVLRQHEKGCHLKRETCFNNGIRFA